MGAPGRGLQDPWGRWALISGSVGGAGVRGHRGLRGLVRWAGGRELNRRGSAVWLGRVHGGTFRGPEAQAGVSAGDREEKVVSQQRHCSETHLYPRETRTAVCRPRRASELQEEAEGGPEAQSEDGPPRRPPSTSV